MSEPLNAIELAVFVARCAAVCDEMGLILRSAAFSPNIKDRLDYSCALFDAQGRMFAQAAHVPVHLGSMAFAMQEEEYTNIDVVANSCDTVSWLRCRRLSKLPSSNTVAIY